MWLTPSEKTPMVACMASGVVGYPGANATVPPTREPSGPLLAVVPKLSPVEPTKVEKVISGSSTKGKSG